MTVPTLARPVPHLVNPKSPGEDWGHGSRLALSTLPGGQPGLLLAACAASAVLQHNHCLCVWGFFPAPSTKITRGLCFSSPEWYLQDDVHASFHMHGMGTVCRHLRVWKTWWDRGGQMWCSHMPVFPVGMNKNYNGNYFFFKKNKLISRV